ncbi:beta-ketoacyl synthase chain length factor [Rhodanobacter sp. AS-Z3]|uniref:beta-ketoacyl synthase chain length factor n=1 Tax=Rhodanobacter sp. AS-Z3 TaxID=3031330 RepID=UPI00247AEAF6|nr:beta-ketoacyl synthase chain length factor [Rhodanobacter sp. AS-Z3]WEN15331.1 beta-ketoacyl synthase chain length factor [Rhodanobacter sp. AS-Z3]
MSALQVFVDGVGVWSPQLADFASLRSVLEGQSPEPPARRPAAATLPANERRRAPESVLLAVEVAGQAIAMSGQDAASVACVFASSHGDQAITDYMCATLASAPTELSPIRFHNSVHNAAVGYWTIATGCHAPSTAIAAQRASFGAGLLEAASQACAEQRPVLLVCSDFTGTGPLLEVTGCAQTFGCALLLSPQQSGRSIARLRLTLTSTRPCSTLGQPLADWCEANPSAAALPLLALLAQGAGSCQLDAAAQLGLQIDMEPVI